MKSIARLISSLSVCVFCLVGCGTPDPILPPPPSVDLAMSAKRGSNLVGGLGACGFCHSLAGLPGDPLSGGRLMRDAYGDVHGPNITRAQSGIGGWNEVEVMKALRANVRPDGSEIVSRLHRGFEWLADADVTAIISYLRAAPAQEYVVSRRSSSFFERYTTGMFDSRIEVKGYIPSVGPQFKIEYGKYLTDHVARCGSCHTKPGDLLSSEEYLAGGKEVSFDGNYKIAPNITPSIKAGIGAWGDSGLKEYLLSGRTPAGRPIDSQFCPVRFYAQTPTEQLEAVVAYLRTVPEID